MNNRTWILSAFLAFALLARQAWGAEVDRSGFGVPKNTAQNPSGDAGDLKLLHSWLDTVLLGFNSAGHCMVFNGALRAMEALDLSASPRSRMIWNVRDVGQVICGAVSADGLTLATVEDRRVQGGAIQNQIRLWNSLSGESQGPNFAPTDVWRLAFSSDGKILAALGVRGSVRVFDVASGQMRSSMALPQPLQASWIGIQVSPNGRYAAARNSFAYSIWNLVESKLVDSEQSKIYLEISPDWKLAKISNRPANYRDIRFELRDFAVPEAPGPLAKPLADALTNQWSVAGYSPDGKLLALRERSGVLRFWDTEKNGILDRPAMKVGKVSKIIFSPHHQWLAVFEDERMREGIASGNIRVWEVATGQLIGPAQPIRGMFLDWLIDRESRFLAVSYIEGSGEAVHVWKLPNSNSIMRR